MPYDFMSNLVIMCQTLRAWALKIEHFINDQLINNFQILYCIKILTLNCYKKGSVYDVASF